MADNISDNLADSVTTHAVNILRVSAGMRDEVLGMLKDLQGSLIKDIEEHGSNPRVEALLKQTDQTIKSAYQDIAQDHDQKLTAIVKAEAEQGANLLNHAIGIDVATVAHSPKQLEAIASKTLIEGHYPAQWWAAQSKDLQDRFAGAMREGMLRGESIDQMVNRVRGTKSIGYTDGIMQASKSQAEALVRTSVQSVSNEARLATFRENPDVVKGIQWLSVLDSRTTVICRGLDGLQWDLNYKPIGHNKVFPGPIAHWNCRSTQIAITFSWKELGEKSKAEKGDKYKGVKNIPEVTQDSITKAVRKKAKDAGMDETETEKLEAKTRASMDGQVAETLTFGDWVASKPESFQDQVLGTQQAQLFRAGKITMRDLTDQGNRPLKISELQKLATQKQLVPVKSYAENQGGLTLHERQIAEDQLATMIARGVEMTTYLNSTTGHTVSQQNQLVTKKTGDEIAALDPDTVIKTALTEKDIMTIFEARYFANYGVDRVKVVLLDGSTINIEGEFTQDAIETLSATLTLSSTKPTKQKIVDALKAAGFTVMKTKENNVQVQTPKPLK